MQTIYAAHFEYGHWLHMGHRPACMSLPCRFGPEEVVKATLHHRPGAVVLKVTSIKGEIIGYAPGGMACV